MRRPFLIVALSAFLAVALTTAPVFAHGGGGGGGGHGGGGGGHGGGGFRGGGGGGGYRGVAPRMPSYGGAVMRAPAYSVPRMQNFAGARGGAAARSPVANARGCKTAGPHAASNSAAEMWEGWREWARADSGRAPVANLGNGTGMGNFRSFGNTGFGSANHALAVSGGNRIGRLRQRDSHQLRFQRYQPQRQPRLRQLGGNRFNNFNNFNRNRFNNLAGSATAGSATRSASAASGSVWAGVGARLWWLRRLWRLWGLWWLWRLRWAAATACRAGSTVRRCMTMATVPYSNPYYGSYAGAAVAPCLTTIRSRSTP